MRKILMTVLLVVCGVAHAEDKKAEAPPPAAPAPAAPAGARADVKAGTGVEKHEVVGEGSSFAKDSTVWAWSRVFNANGTNVKHVWKVGGKEVWTGTLPVGSAAWSTMTRMTVRTAGSWEVDVQTEAGASIGKVSFTVN
jgi:hypothetical protein